MTDFLVVLNSRSVRISARCLRCIIETNDAIFRVRYLSRIPDPFLHRLWYVSSRLHFRSVE